MYIRRMYFWEKKKLSLRVKRILIITKLGRFWTNYYNLSYFNVKLIRIVLV